MSKSTISMAIYLIYHSLNPIYPDIEKPWKSSHLSHFDFERMFTLW